MLSSVSMVFGYMPCGRRPPSIGKVMVPRQLVAALEIQCQAKMGWCLNVGPRGGFPGAFQGPGAIRGPFQRPQQPQGGPPLRGPPSGNPLGAQPQRSMSSGLSNIPQALRPAQGAAPSNQMQRSGSVPNSNPPTVGGPRQPGGPMPRPMPFGGPRPQLGGGPPNPSGSLLYNAKAIPLAR